MHCSPEMIIYHLKLEFMQTQKSIIVYYGGINAIDKHFDSTQNIETTTEVFVVQEHHKEEVPGEYYDNPEEYYRIKFKQKGYDVTLQTYSR